MFARMFDDPLPTEGVELDALLSALEQRLMSEALKRCCGNVSAAARLLRLNRTTLIHRLKRQRMAA